MKIEIELPDLETLYYPNYYDEGVTADDVKKAIVERVINQFINQAYNDIIDDEVCGVVTKEVKELVKNNSKEIIDRVVDRVSEEMLRKKTIMSEMPKKSEIVGINKEWETYFTELIDKALAKRFK